MDGPLFRIAILKARTAMLTSDRTIELTPNWEPLCLWFALALAEHAFEQDNRLPVVSFIEQVRYLALTDPEALERVMAKLRRPTGR
jgi:hypothetical protein